MSIDIVAALRRATDATRALDVAEATRLIQQALGIRSADAEATGAAPQARRAGPDVEDAEIVAPPRRPGRRARRRPLAEVVRTLREGRAATANLRALHGPRPAPHLPLPDGARFEAHSYAGAAGSRDYRLYVPASAARRARGLVVMLHGCTQTPDDFAAGTGMNALAEAHGLLVAYPGQTASDNPNACWNWYRPKDQARGTGEPAIIAGLTSAVAAEFDVPADRIFVAGLSAGGAMAAILGETYPDLYAAVGVHSGLPRGAASDVRSAFAAMRRAPAVGTPPPAGRTPRVIVFHGGADATVHPSNAAEIFARASAGVPDATPEPAAAGFQRRAAQRPLGHPPGRRQRGGRALADRRRRPRLVGRPPRRDLHRPVRPRRLGRDGSLLPRNLESDIQSDGIVRWLRYRGSTDRPVG